MENNENTCKACRDKAFRLAQEKHPSAEMRSLFTTFNRMRSDMEILETKLAALLKPKRDLF